MGSKDLPPSSVTFFEENFYGAPPEGNDTSRFYQSTLTQGEDWLPTDIDPLEKAIEKDPLTAEMVTDEFAHAVSLETGSKLFTTVPGETAYRQALKDAGDEIVSHYLWRMGLPSELARFMDIDNAETRDLLVGEYEKIPEDVDRDNSPNSFRKRWTAFKDHLATQGVSIAEQKDAIDIWRGDLQVRLDITEEIEGDNPFSIVEEFRHEMVDKLFTSEIARDRPIIEKIGNTLLGLSRVELEEFKNDVQSRSALTEEAQRNKENLLTFIDEFHLSHK